MKVIEVDFSDSASTFTYNASLVSISPKDDLAVIYVVPAEYVPVTPQILCENPPNTFDEVYSIGAGLGLPVYPTKGIVSSISTSLPGITYPFIQHTASTVPGNSGGPLFTIQDNRYCILGLNARAHYTYSHLSFAVPYYKIKDFLDKVY